jgi:ribonuclease HI
MKTTPIAPLIAEAGLLPATTLLNDRQRKYVARLVGLPEGHQAKNVLPTKITNGNQEEEPDEDYTPCQVKPVRAGLGTRLAKGIQDVIDEKNGMEIVKETTKTVEGTVLIKDRETATNEVKEASTLSGILFTDGSRLDSGHAGCSMVWKKPDEEWHQERYHMGNWKEIFDAELYAIAEALKLAFRRNIRNPTNIETVQVYSDSTAALQRIKDPNPAPGQWIMEKIVEMEHQIMEIGHRGEYKGVPGHANIKGNEIADAAARIAAKHPIQRQIRRLQAKEHFTSLSHLHRYNKRRRPQKKVR